MDESGLTLAGIRVSKLSGDGKSIDLMVPCEDWVVDLIALSGLAAAAMDKKTSEVMGEIVGAVAGG